MKKLWLCSRCLCSYTGRAVICTTNGFPSKTKSLMLPYYNNIGYIKANLLTLVSWCCSTQLLHSSLLQSRHLALASRCFLFTNLQKSHICNLDGFWRSMTSVRLATRKLSGSFFTPPRGSDVLLRQRGHVNSR